MQRLDWPYGNMIFFMYIDKQLMVFQRVNGKLGVAIKLLSIVHSNFFFSSQEITGHVIYRTDMIAVVEKNAI